MLLSLTHWPHEDHPLLLRKTDSTETQAYARHGPEEGKAREAQAKAGTAHASGSRKSSINTRLNEAGMSRFGSVLNFFNASTSRNLGTRCIDRCTSELAYLLLKSYTTMECPLSPAELGLLHCDGGRGHLLSLSLTIGSCTP